MDVNTDIMRKSFLKIVYIHIQIHQEKLHTLMVRFLLDFCWIKLFLLELKPAPITKKRVRSLRNFDNALKCHLGAK